MAASPLLPLTNTKEDMINASARSMGSTLLAFLLRFNNIGLHDKVERGEVKYVRFLNVVVGLTSLGFLFYIPVSILQNHYLLASLQGMGTVLILVALWLNHTHRHKAARLLYLLLLNLFILTTAVCIGHQSTVSDFFYLSFVLPFLLFRISEYKNVVAGLVMSILFFNIYHLAYPYYTSYNLSPEAQQIIFSINTWMKFLFFGLSIYILAYHNYTSENELSVINHKLNEQAIELKRSNEDLEQFAYIISHDLKAPVRSIASFMKLTMMRNQAILDGPTKEYIELSRSSAERMVRQIEDLLAYCKVGRNLPPAGTIDLNQMMRTIRTELGERITANNARVIVARELPALKDMHSNMLHHIFQNLIANGIKFNANPTPEVVVDYKMETDVVRFSVTDNGIGIAPGFEKKLFQMFQRLHTSEEFEGTGIGLSVCKKIVNFYKGEIWFESKKGEGTTFHFNLPIALVETEADKISFAQRKDITYTHIPNSYSGDSGPLIVQAG